MKNIQVDSDGEMRCWNCGGKHFQDRRTARAHIVGYATVGVGALATKKKLRCKLCGKYNDTGSADRYTGAPANPSAPAAAPVAAPAPATPAPATPAPAAAAPGPIEVKVVGIKVHFDGTHLELKRIGKTTTLHISEIEAVETFDKAGFGSAGVWFRTASTERPQPKKLTNDPHGFTYPNSPKNSERVQQLVNAVRAAIE